MTADRIDQAVEYAQALALAGFGIVEAYAPAGLGACTCREGADCESPGKHPVGAEWQKRATRSPHTIGQIVRRREGQYGVIPWPGERGLILDVDRADALPVKLPASLRVKSGKPGHGHAYFRLPAGYNAATLPASAAWGEVRVEGASRHVIGPWSRHGETGAVYTPTGTPDAIAELPADVLAQLAPPAQLTITVGNGQGYRLPEPGYTGSRYDEILRYIASRWRPNVTEAELWLGVRDVLAPLFAEPLTGAELQSRFARAWRDTPRRLNKAASNHSSAPDAPSERKELPFVTARAFAASTPEEVDWIVRHYVAAGSLTYLVGGPKVAGKTTFSAHLIRSAVDGIPFLDQPVARTAVVVLTEQAPSSLRPLLERADLLDRSDLHLLLWRDTRGASWPAIVEAAVAECRRIGARLLVIDTRAQFSGLAGDAENDAGAALEAMRPLQEAAGGGLAVLVIDHERKGAGAVGESARGSSAFAGAVDVILALRRGDGESRPTIRHLYALSRFDETPEELVIELTERGYVALGSAANFAVEEARQAVLETVGDEPLTTSQIVESTGLKRTAVYAALAQLGEGGQVVRDGRGTKGDPYRYSAAASVSPEPIPDVIGPDERIEASGATPPEADLSLVWHAQKVFGDDVLSVGDA